MKHIIRIICLLAVFFPCILHAEEIRAEWESARTGELYAEHFDGTDTMLSDAYAVVYRVSRAEELHRSIHCALVSGDLNGAYALSLQYLQDASGSGVLDDAAMAMGELVLPPRVVHTDIVHTVANENTPENNNIAGMDGMAVSPCRTYGSGFAESNVVTVVQIFSLKTLHHFFSLSTVPDIFSLFAYIWESNPDYASGNVLCQWVPSSFICPLPCPCFLPFNYVIPQLYVHVASPERSCHCMCASTLRGDV